MEGIKNTNNGVKFGRRSVLTEEQRTNMIRLKTNEKPSCTKVDS